MWNSQHVLLNKLLTSHFMEMCLGTFCQVVRETGREENLQLIETYKIKHHKLVHLDQLLRSITQNDDICPRQSLLWPLGATKEQPVAPLLYSLWMVFPWFRGSLTGGASWSERGRFAFLWTGAVLRAVTANAPCNRRDALQAWDGGGGSRDLISPQLPAVGMALAPGWVHACLHKVIFTAKTC